VLDEPRLVVFDHGQCVEIAHRAEQFAGLVVLAASIPATNASRMTRSMCAPAACSTWSCTAFEGVERRHLLALALEPTRDGGQQILLAVLEHLDLVPRLKRAALFPRCPAGCRRWSA